MSPSSEDRSAQDKTAQMQVPGHVPVGTRIDDRYEVRALLGEGGFAAVYLAFDTEIKREVAIKVLDLAVLKGKSVDNILERFRREAQLAARIRHPSVVQIFDIGVLPPAAQPYIVMEYLEGWDLEGELSRNGPMTPQRALPLFCDALDALGEAHGLGIVHKDLKPSNLFLSDPGTRRERLRLVDFGIAHLGEETESRLTATGRMLGTPAYIAPEYAETGDVSAAVDVYQMGLILVEMLTGQPVVNHDIPLKCVMSHVSGELYIPVALLDGPLGPIVSRAVALEPGARYPNARAFLDALAEVAPEAVVSVSGGGELRRIAPVSADILPAPRTTADLGHADTLAVEAVSGPGGGEKVLAQTITVPDVQRPVAGVMTAGERTSERRSWWFPVAVAALVLVASTLVCGAVALRAMFAGAAAEEGISVTHVEEEVDEDDEPPRDERFSKEARAGGDEPAAEAISRVVEITSEPSRADIIRDKKVIGRTPYEATIDGDEAFTVVLRRDGFQEETFEVFPGSEKVELHAELAPLSRRSEKRPRNRDKGAEAARTKGKGKGNTRGPSFTILGEDP